jgi:hypothetical protein
MQKSARLLALAALLACGTAAPALATWVPLTAVPVDSRASIDFADASPVLPNRVEAISLRAGNTDVMCSSIDAFFRSGETMRLFSGLLPMGRENVIQMLPVHRDLARIEFHCKAVNGGVGDISVAANVVAGGVIVEPAG